MIKTKIFFLLFLSLLSNNCFNCGSTFAYSVQCVKFTSFPDVKIIHKFWSSPPLEAAEHACVGIGTRHVPHNEHKKSTFSANTFAIYVNNTNETLSSDRLDFLLERTLVLLSRIVHFSSVQYCFDRPVKSDCVEKNVQCVLFRCLVTFVPFVQSCFWHRIS